MAMIPRIDGPIEPALEPDLPICDAHFHTAPKYDYYLEDFLRDTGSGHNVVTSVYAETLNNYYYPDGPELWRSIGEIEQIGKFRQQTLDGRTQVGAAIVGYVELTSGAAAGEMLDAAIEKGAGGLRGIRINQSWDDTGTLPPSREWLGPDLYNRADFREGLKEVIARNLSIDTWQFFNQLPKLAQLVRAFPDGRYIVDHCGGLLGAGAYAGKDEEIFHAWRSDLSTLASFPNVYMKIGGLGNWINSFGFPSQPVAATSEDFAKAWRPYIETCIELFGANRCMFESNFPVESPCGRYGTVWNGFKRVTAGASADEKRMLYHDTAREFYRF
jgi:L-fuconolactonase